MDELEFVRNQIREHRDCQGHDRCWRDDVKLYAVTLPEDTLPNLELPPKEEFMMECEKFRSNRACSSLEDIKICRNFFKRVYGRTWFDRIYDIAFIPFVAATFMGLYEPARFKVAIVTFLSLCFINFWIKYSQDCLRFLYRRFVK